MPIFIILYTVLGLCLGSFFSVIGIRWGLEEHKTRKWYKGRSQCDSCGAILRWYELIPVASYIIQRGKCRRCGAKIGIKPFLCELGCGFGWALLGIYTYTNIAQSEAVITATIAVTYFSFAAVTDFLSHCIEAVTGYIAAALMLILHIYSHMGDASLKAYVLISIIAVVISAAIEAVNRDSIVGNGDIQCLLLLFLAAGYCDINGFLSAIFYTVLLAGIASLAYKLAGKGKTTVALVPFFYFGYLLLLTAGKIQFIWERGL